MFQEVHAKQESSIKVSISYVEIYNEMMYDLLASLPDQDTISSSSSSAAAANSLVIAEVSNTIMLPYIVEQWLQDNKGNVYVKGLSIRLAENEEEALNMLFEVSLLLQYFNAVIFWCKA